MTGVAPPDRIGGCQCGAVRYASTGPPAGLYACHCRECRRQSSSAFGLSLIVPRAGFEVTAGVPGFWIRPTDSGHTLRCAFCPTCGSRLWHERLGGDETLSIKAGSLDQPIDLTGAVHIWTRRKLPGLEIPAGARQFPGEPDA